MFRANHIAKQVLENAIKCHEASNAFPLMSVAAPNEKKHVEVALVLDSVELEFDGKFTLYLAVCHQAYILHRI